MLPRNREDILSTITMLRSMGVRMVDEETIKQEIRDFLTLEERDSYFNCVMGVAEERAADRIMMQLVSPDSTQ